MMADRYYGKLRVSEYATATASRAAAADEFVAIVNRALDEQNGASVILASANPQLDFMQAARASPDLDWRRITVFHLDEYHARAAPHRAGQHGIPKTTGG
jgi:glucosamine-6-phosphate deaminase